MNTPSETRQKSYLYDEHLRHFYNGPLGIFWVTISDVSLLNDYCAREQCGIRFLNSDLNLIHRISRISRRQIAYQRWC